MIHDKETNVVYFSEWLAKDHKKFYEDLTNILNEQKIAHRLLHHTKDYWVRDFMPIQLSQNDFLKYKYQPSYLSSHITDCEKACDEISIKFRKTDIIIDGGNMVPCGDYIIMTDKVFTENGYDKGNLKFRQKFETELKHPVIIIPWHKNYDDIYGHADGFVKWCGGNKVLMSNHRETDPKDAQQICDELTKHGFEVTEMSYKLENPTPKYNWAYINFLQVGCHIIMPKFDIEEDNIAKCFIQKAFPDCDIRMIEMKYFADKGGALHCLSWNIKV